MKFVHAVLFVRDTRTTVKGMVNFKKSLIAVTGNAD